MSTEDKTRSFICIDFPSEIIKEVARIQHVLKTHTKFTGKLTELENIHLTLKFLGHTNKQTLEKAKQVFSTINFQVLNLKLHSIGVFNFKNNPKIVWIKVTGNIFKLQKEIDLALSDLFKPEDRFMSHLTIARIKHTKSPKLFSEYVSNIKPKRLSFQIKDFKLKSSNLTPQGPIYKTLKKYRLGCNRPT
jgi:RNA 2',3'-cyclic 3'-phosphodiesterase